MKKRNLFLFSALFISISLFAQKTDLTKKEKPLSIYTFELEKDVNSFSALNKKLDLEGLEFVTVDAFDIENNIMVINSKFIGKKPSVFIYDDYNKYQNENFLKGFLLKNDPTRWNLHLIQNRIQPYFLNKQ
ncbi:hypothetical protein H9I45_12870 [Polaribacter haliotis]|uniref:DUF4174 domain-containing protein n=1 Tax=Polaribacter haliotis TaxID=1888915 RepID=A0A7L8ADZ5_9FLAO|nr:hypothetical protein [Polaribacter haliotis]QOD60226.1 hypothetical protein H9I45_12870 [Polaribacter haliotis]